MSEFESFDDQQLADLAREGRDHLQPLPPTRAASILAAIAAEVDDDGAGAFDPDGTQSVLRHPAGRSRSNGGPLVNEDPVAASAVVRSIGSGRSRWRTALPYAAAAASVVAAVAIVLPNVGSDAPATFASVTLEPLVEDGQPAVADLVRDDDGRRVQLDLTGVDAGDGFLEVWLLDEDSGSLVSLGPARADGDYEVPETVDLIALPTLDVSVEPLDGDPGHSGQSVLRGTLTW